MFDDLNKKKENVEDIFADTEQEELVNNVEPISNPPRPEEPQAQEQDIQSENLGSGKKKNFLKIIIIAVLLILISVGAYFAYNAFLKNNAIELDSEIIVVGNELDNQEEEWVELVDPNLIIPPEEEEEEIVVIDEEEVEEEEPLNLVWLERIENLNLALIDSDGDGLFDLAEEYIGTDPFNPDTDGDGFTDLQEILNGYNPLGEGLLPEDFIVSYYQDDLFEFLYPSNANLSRQNDLMTISLEANLRDQVGIYKQENMWQTDIFSWYASQFPNAGRIDNSRIINHPNLGAGIIDEDGLALYFTSNDFLNIITISWQSHISDFEKLSVILSALNIN